MTIQLVEGRRNFFVITVDINAVQIVPAKAVRRQLVIKNNSRERVYLHNEPNVTVDNGFPLGSDDTLTGIATEAWYAVVESGTADLRIIEVVR